ncbi:MAG: L-2-hydroxyglutarate oxidase [Bacteroidota bacterium]
MKYDVVIIGAGIVGLATALKIKEKNRALSVIVIDKEDQVAAHQTGHNSGVIHSGLYYKPGSLKATNCITGYHMLIDFCQKHEVAYELCGKVVVATRNEEKPYLHQLAKRGEENGLEGLKLISAEELREHEPYVSGVEAIFVPQTGIIDYRGVCIKYAKLFEQYEGLLKLGEKVLDIQQTNTGSTVVTTRASYNARLVVSCAGLYSDKIAKLTEQKLDVKIIPFRGEYFELTEEKQHLVNNLIYPVPDPNFPFLGVHFTRMINGGIEAGPNAVFAFKREGYKRSDIHFGELIESLTWPGFQKVAGKYWKTGVGELYRSFSKSAFTKALQKLMPSIESKDLVPGGAGVRAQACDRTGGLIDDFLILENEQAINVCNAPSPAATSSLSIGNTVSDLVIKRFE